MDKQFHRRLTHHETQRKGELHEIKIRLGKKFGKGGLEKEGRAGVGNRKIAGSRSLHIRLQKSLFGWSRRAQEPDGFNAHRKIKG
jgi:hypothetical protein